MKKFCCLVVLLALFATPAGAVPQSATAQPLDHSPWDRVLKKFVTETGRVDYAALKADSPDLDRYVEQLAARSPASHPQDFPTRESQLAYWINAYNALVMKGVIENWPVASVRKIGTLPFSFFWRKKFVAGGSQHTLNHIEDILRKKLVEPRIHFAIVCASNSCPRLQREAYAPETVERLLAEAARFYVNEPRNLKMDAARNRVTLPQILSYYHEDFENYVRAKNLSHSGQPLVDYIRLYANPKNRAALDALKNPRVGFFGYDWGVNDVHSPVATGKLAAKEAYP